MASALMGWAGGEVIYVKLGGIHDMREKFIYIIFEGIQRGCSDHITRKGVPCVCYSVREEILEFISVRANLS